jgi:hypothetical protein
VISADGTRWTGAEAPDGDCYADPALTVSQGTNVAPGP